MKALIALEAHFYRTPDGTIYNDSVVSYAFWQRYLKVYASIIVLARVQDVAEAKPKWKPASGDRVEFCCLPNYVGPWQMLKTMPVIKQMIREIATECDVAILRVPGAIATFAWKALRSRQIPIGLEVVGDPWDSLAPGTVKSIARPLARVMGTLGLKKQCRQADAVAYVTEHTLQRRYPVRAGNPDGSKPYQTHYSSIELFDEAYVTEPKTEFAKPLRIFNAGSMETLYKGQDIQIRAVRKCRDHGLDVHLVLAGDGRCRPEFEAVCEQLDMREHVTFLGMLPGAQAVREELDRADLFILPSLVEGLPRALIEAMARGLPCVATDVGGIPELMEPSEMVPPRDADALATKLIEVLSDTARMKRLAQENLLKAQKYKAALLNERRTNFYTYLADMASPKNRTIGTQRMVEKA
ncbi:glycosyltransferase family 4 protein [Brevibacillus dissolubilis]|uniref:glycosyltransferase family 4 protein n=1 Tax=Brevibacillus dissolubilis TaxID=1844116 RepID=UPI0011167DD1|nr:glycosyltransferase family 4 protein [Brevibacillus dissolubilis]